MATVKRSSLAQSGTTWGTWFNNLNCSIISASGNVINIDNVFTLTKDDYKVTVKLNGSNLFEMNCNNPCIVTVCCSDTLVYIQISDPQNRRSFLVYEKLPTESIYGYYNSGNTTGIPFKSIVDISFTGLTSGMTYTHKQILNYSVEMGYIDYVDDYIFQNNIKNDKDSNFISCSSVTADNVITFLSQNYYSVGANTLVKIDS